MSSGLRSEGLLWSSYELREKQVPGDGAMCGVGITKRPHKPDEMKMKATAVDAGSKGKRRKKMFPEPEIVDHFLSDEIARYMLSKPPLPAPLCPITQDHFGPDLDGKISALFKESKVRDANILRQYRTNGSVADLELILKGGAANHKYSKTQSLI